MMSVTDHTVNISLGVYPELWLFKLVLYCVGVCICGFCNAWLIYNCMVVSVISVLVFMVFCMVLCIYIYIFSFVLSVLV
jgi:hypothetical protein